MPWIHAGIFLLAGSILLLEIALTRVFAIMLWHHLAYMVVSVAMLGFGAAGSLLTARGTGTGPAPRTLALLTLGYGLAVPACLGLATRLRVDVLGFWQEPANLASLAALYGLVFVPFLLGGAAIGLALSRFAVAATRLYGADLLGSAAGGCASMLLLATWGSSATVVFAGALGLVGASCFALAGERPSLLIIGPALLLATLGCVVFTGGAPPLGIPALAWHVPYAPGKEFAELAKLNPALRLPSPTAELEVGPPIETVPMLGGEFALTHVKKVEARLVGQDGAAPTMLYRNAAELSAFPFLDDSQAGAAYVALAGRGGSAPAVLVIGVGGGVDVMIALANGARSVTGVEVNGAMIDAVTQRFDDYLGGLFRPGAHEWSHRIELVHGEGRSFVRSRSDRWDVIQLSGVDSFTALATGAYTLAESYLYTVEAVKDLYSRLADDGYLSYSRFILAHPRKPRETLRLANVARRALEELGVEDPAAHLLVLQGYRWASTLVKRGAFTAAEVAAVRAFAAERGFRGLVFDPRHPGGEPFVPSVDADERVTDRKQSLRLTRADFEALLRGGPAQRGAFASLYEYDVSPVTDDAPFFFNYYRYRGLLGTDRRERGRPLEDAFVSAAYYPSFPVGHAVLLGSLVQITGVAALLILLPLRGLARRAAPVPGRWRVFTYFAALGAGFMFIEITLMQKLVLFLGHPIYAVTVVLSSLLAFAGLGSLAAGRIGVPGARALRWLLAAILVAILIQVVGVGWLQPALLGWPLAARVAVVVALLAPLGAVLGMPFPLGIRILERRDPELIPWAWAINAFLSVFSAIFCIVLAMAIGFSKVLWIAGCIYAVGLLSIGKLAGRPSEASKLAG